MDSEAFKYDFCVDTKEFSEIGIGIYLYFMYMKFIFFVLFAIFSIVCCAQLYITRQYNLQMQDICQRNRFNSSKFNVDIKFFINNGNKTLIEETCRSFNKHNTNKWTQYFTIQNIGKTIFIKNLIKK